MARPESVLGRQDVLARCRIGLADGGVLLHGPAGMGKSTLLQALAEEAFDRGDLVLRSAPGATEVSLPHVALIDLFGGQLPTYRHRLPVHLRAALETALLNTAPVSGSAVDRLAVRLAVIDLLRVLCSVAPVLLVLDDVQWLDSASADVLRFAARRVADLPIRVLAAERVDHRADPVGVELCPPPVDEIRLDGLPDEMIAELVRSRIGISLSGSVLARVRKSSGGNPFYALELARALCRDGGSSRLDRALPVSDRLRSLVADRLAALPDSCGPALLEVAAEGCLLSQEQPGVTAAVDAGVLVVDGNGAVRFSHPLLAELVYGDASAAMRRETHRRLALLVNDPLRQTRHRALATVGADAALAQDLVNAAVLARVRGAPAAAAQLSRLAAEHTPAGDEAVGQRWLDAARYAHGAGLTEDARLWCLAAIDGSDRVARVHARLLMWELAGHDKSAVNPMLDLAAADADGDLGLTGWVKRFRSERALREAKPLLADAELVDAQELAEQVDDHNLLLQVLAMRIPVELQRNEPLAWQLVQRANQIADDADLTPAAIHVRMAAVVALLRRGQTEDAIEAAQRVRAEVERTGRLRELCWVLYTLASVHERAGLSLRAAEYADASAKLRADIDPTPGPCLTMRAAAQLNTGTAEAAADLLDSAVLAGEQAQDREWLAYALGMRGRAHILLREPESAAKALDRARTLLLDIGYQDPALFLLDADLAEALAANGETHRAIDVIKDARVRADRLGRDVVQLGLDRAEATIGDPRAGADALRAAMPPHHPYPMELTRAWLTLGLLERRARRRAAARVALQTALDQFTACGCLPWQRFTETELARLSTADTPATDLELRLVDLLRSGATNRQIAVDLYLSVKAVEANLTKLYRKFGVHNRVELIATVESTE